MEKSSGESTTVPKALAEFGKLFGVSFPKSSEAVYYLNTLSRSPKYANIWQTVKEFVEFEKWLRETELYNGKVASYKFKMVDAVKSKIRSTPAFQRWEKVDFKKDTTFNFAIENKMMENLTGDEWQLSIDLTSANFLTFCLFDEENELKDGNWAEFLLSIPNMHPILTKSKMFRQIVFGNINSRHNSRIQKQITGHIIKYLLNELGDDFLSRILSYQNDEIIISCGHGKDLDENALQLITQIIRAISEPIPIFFGKEIRLGKHYKYTLYKTRAFTRQNNCVKTKYTIQFNNNNNDNDTNDNNSDDVAVVGVTNPLDELWAVPGNKFYFYFKKHILKEPCEVRDLYFVVDGQLAMWVDDQLDAHDLGGSTEEEDEQEEKEKENSNKNKNKTSQ